MTTSGGDRKVGIELLILALFGAIAISIGAGLWSLPAGLVVGGAELVMAAYLIAYWRARG